ncbi:hypothetical protein ACFSZS_17300 [Seohaeicola zhoushanensis]
MLVLAEDPRLGYYDAEIAGAVIEAALGMGVYPRLREVAFSPDAVTPDAALLAEMGAADRVLFLARLGDQLRFDPALDSIRPVVSYALDAATLGTDFGRAHHHAFEALKSRINTALAGAGQIRVTCPLGTDFAGPGARFPETGGEVGIARFPMAVFAPVPAGAYSGRIAQAGFLIGTGSRYYDPYALALDDVLLVHFEETASPALPAPPQMSIAPRATTARSARALASAGPSCIPGTLASIPAAVLPVWPARPPNAGPAAPSAAHGCCIFTPAAPMRRGDLAQRDRPDRGPRRRGSLGARPPAPRPDRRRRRHPRPLPLRGGGFAAPAREIGLGPEEADRAGSGEGAVILGHGLYGGGQQLFALRPRGQRGM